MFSRGSLTFVEIVVEGGPRRGALMPVGKWERTIICERTKLGICWMQEGKAIARLLGIKGMISITPFSYFKGVVSLWIQRKKLSGFKTREH